MYVGKAPIMSPNLPLKILPKIPKNIRTIKTCDANLGENPASVNNGIRWTIGTAMQLQQKITAMLIHIITSLSLKGKLFGKVVADFFLLVPIPSLKTFEYRQIYKVPLLDGEVEMFVQILLLQVFFYQPFLQLA